MAREDELTLEEKCENLLNMVVESRKQYGKLWLDYSNKSTLVQDKMLNLHLKTIANFKNKLNKNLLLSTTEVKIEDDTEGFSKDVIERKKILEELGKKIAETRLIVDQMKSNSNVNKKLHLPLTVEAFMEQTKKNLEIQENDL